MKSRTTRIDPSRRVTLRHLVSLFGGRPSLEAWVVRDADEAGRDSVAWFGSRLEALRFVGEREYRLVGEDEVRRDRPSGEFRGRGFA